MKTLLRRLPRLMPMISALVALMAVASACLDNSITGVRELSMVLTSDRTIVSVGDSVNFEYQAEGTGLIAVSVEFGDGGADTASVSGGFETPDDLWNSDDTLFYRGPIEVGGRLTHAFDGVGTFLVIGHVVAAAGMASDTVVITVN